MLEVGHIFEHPALTLSLFKFAPFIRSEEPISVRYMKKLAKQAKNLGFGPEGKVSDNDISWLNLKLHL